MRVKLLRRSRVMKCVWWQTRVNWNKHALRARYREDHLLNTSRWQKTAHTFAYANTRSRNLDRSKITMKKISILCKAETQVFTAAHIGSIIMMNYGVVKRSVEYWAINHERRDVSGVPKTSRILVFICKQDSLTIYYPVYAIPTPRFIRRYHKTRFHA